MRGSRYKRKRLESVHQSRIGWTLCSGCITIPKIMILGIVVYTDKGSLRSPFRSASLNPAYRM